MLSIDDLNGDDREAMRGSRHTSQDDSDLGSDLAYHRVSVDLMNDADIQQVFKKSYSLEDLTRLTQEVEEPDQGQDALVSGAGQQVIHHWGRSQAHCSVNSLSLSLKHYRNIVDEKLITFLCIIFEPFGFG